MQEKLYYLKLLRPDIGEERFKFCAAAIIAQEYSSLLYFRGIKSNMKRILEVTNRLLDSLDCDPISYEFIRSHSVILHKEEVEKEKVEV